MPAWPVSLPEWIRPQLTELVDAAPEGDQSSSAGENPATVIVSR